MKKMIVGIYGQNGQKQQQVITFRQNKQTQTSINLNSSTKKTIDGGSCIERHIKVKQDKIGMKYEKQFYKKESQSELLSYSYTKSFVELEDINVLIKKLVFLLSSQLHVSSHVQNSLRVKGYHTNIAKQVSCIVASSFAQYISIADKINGFQAKDQRDRKEDQVGYVRKDVEMLRIENQMWRKENEKQIQTLNKLQKQNDILMKKVLKLSISHEQSQKRKQMFSSLSIEVSRMMKEMNKLQTKIYKQLSILQEKLIPLSKFRNKISFQASFHSVQKYPLKDITPVINNQTNKQGINKNDDIISKLKQKLQEKEQLVTKLQQKITQIYSQLKQEQKLYDQMIDKNIELQKQLFFCQNNKDTSFSQEESLNITENRSFQPYNSPQ